MILIKLISLFHLDYPLKRLSTYLNKCRFEDAYSVDPRNIMSGYCRRNNRFLDYKSSLAEACAWSIKFKKKNISGKKTPAF